MGELSTQNSRNHSLQIRQVKDLSPRLSEEEIQIVLGSAIRLHEMDLIEAKKQMADIIVQTFMTSGFRIDPEEKKVVAMMIINNTLKRWPNFSIADFKMACQKGVLKDFGEYMGLSVVTFDDWCKAFSTQVRNEALMKQRTYEQAMEDERNNTKTPEQKAQMIKDGICACFDNFKANGRIMDAGSATFKALYNNKILKLDEGQIESYKVRAKQNLIERNNTKKANGVHDLRKMSSMLTEIANGTQDAKQAIDSEAKSLALRDFFTILVSQNKHIKDSL